MTYVYVHLLGNRDIQTIEKIEPFTKENHEGTNTYIIDQREFKDKSEMVLKNFEQYEKYIILRLTL